jgi:hypothetical protein
MLGLIVLLQVTPKMTTVHLEGWTLNVEASLVGESTWYSAKSELARQLQQIKRVVPDGPLEKLKKVTIWVHRKSPETPCMAYHPGAEWLKQHNMEPEMAKCVEIGSAENFVSWTYEQPWMVMHELAHAYHDQFLDKGFENKVVKDAYNAAMESKKYESVLHWNGSETKHYATSNQMEYFSESTESYFGTNDFYPFVRAELKTYDPDTFKMLESVWGKPVKRK